MWDTITLKRIGRWQNILNLHFKATPKRSRIFSPFLSMDVHGGAGKKAEGENINYSPYIMLF